MWIISVTPTTRLGRAHIWIEGGVFFTEESAEFQAKQIRKMKDRYSKVEVVLDLVGKKFKKALRNSSQLLQERFSEINNLQTK